MLTQEFLQSILEYNSGTGAFIWRTRKDIQLNYRVRWNERYAGKKAGCAKTDSKGYTYWYIAINNVHYLGHRLAILYVTGKLPIEADHWNGDTLDNRFSNLRDSDKSLNQANRIPALQGFEWDKGKCVVRIQHFGERIFIGRYDNITEAQEAYKIAHKEIFGEFSVYNRPVGD